MDIEKSSSSTTLLAIGLALGIGVCALFLLHNISINIRLNNTQPVAAQSDLGATYNYDEGGRLTSIMPVKLKPV